MPGTSKVQGGFQSTVRVDEELGKYQNKYEESMNPFEAFRGRVSVAILSINQPLKEWNETCISLRPDMFLLVCFQERGRAIHMLNPIEKVLLSLSTIVLGNRYMRNLFVLYAFGLHFVVLSTLYSSISSAEHMTKIEVPPPPL